MRCIRRLFLGLFRFIFRLRRSILRFNVIQLTTNNVSFASRFLDSRSRFLTLSISTDRNFTRVFRIINRALLLFISIRLFSMVGRLLLRAILIVISTRHFFWYVNGTFPCLNRAFLLMELSKFRRPFSIISFFYGFLFRDYAFLLTRIGRVLRDNFSNLFNYDPFFIQRFLRICTNRRIKRTRRDNGPIFQRQGVTDFEGNFCLIMVIFCRNYVSKDDQFNNIFFRPCERIGFPTFRYLNGRITSFRFFFAVR